MGWPFPFTLCFSSPPFSYLALRHRAFRILRISVVHAGLRSVASGFEKSPGLKKMFSMNLPENKINDLRNDFETDYKILIGEVIIEKLNVEDLYEIIRYG